MCSRERPGTFRRDIPWGQTPGHVWRSRSCLQPVASRSGLPASTACLCARIRGVRATASSSDLPPGLQRRLGWTSSMGGRCRRGGRAWFVVDPKNLGRKTPYGTVAEVVERARSAGGTVEERDDGSLAVHVVAAVTHTIGGLVVDERARVLSKEGTPIEGLYAAGVDAGGWSTGGYASGLAAAVVFGRIAAQEIVK